MNPVVIIGWSVHLVYLLNLTLIALYAAEDPNYKELMVLFIWMILGILTLTGVFLMLFFPLDELMKIMCTPIEKLTQIY